MITQATIDQEIKEFKEAHLISIREKALKYSGAQPLTQEISILGYDLNEKTFGAINLPVGDGMTDEARIAHLFAHVIPSLFKFFDDHYKQVICFSFFSEVWSWEGKGEPGIKPDFAALKKGPKTEKLAVTFESQYECEVIVFSIVRNKDGAITGLTDQKVLNTSTGAELTGRIPEVFKRYNRLKFN
jgi:hypothetical protein